MHNVATISTFALFFVTCIHLWTINWLYSPLLVLLSGDAEINQGSRHNSGETFSISHWSLNSVSAYNYTKLSSLKAFIAVHKFDIVRFSETYLDSSVAPDDGNLEISGYSLVRSDILLTISAEEFVYTIKIVYHCEFLTSNTYMNA